MTIAIFGGLGNQMFQYAFGRALGELHCEATNLDIRFLQDPVQRPYRLDSLSVLKPSNEAVLPAMPSSLERRLKWAPLKRGVRYYFERSFAFDPEALRIGGPAYFWGVWQSPLYFEAVAPTIRREFALPEPMTLRRSTIGAAIEHSASATVHVRRGDYVTNKKANAYHGTLSAEWYAEARRVLDFRFGKLKYFVFSDDPAWAKESLTAYHDAEFIEPDADGRDFEDMHLMSLGHHQIIANSSFSWWAAWLNRNPDKQIIAPARWFAAPGINTNDLLPESWVRL